jgi:predicted nucleotidyltransferase
MGSGNASAAQRRHPGRSRPSRVDLRSDALRDRLSALLGCDVDLVEEAAVRPRLRQAIDREGVRAF